MNRNNMRAINVPALSVDLKCSCSACDSMACYAKRQKDKFCTCNECTKSKRCIDSIGKSHSTLASFDDKELEEEFARELMEEEEFEFDKYNTILTEKPATDSNKSLKKNLEGIADNNKSNNTFPNLTVTSGRNKASTAQLSAQVMNVPYIDFKNSIAPHKPEPFSNFPKMSFYDLYQKIKEVYKACSCKVCECVAEKSGKNEVCKCRPCECNECKSTDLEKKVELSKAKTFTRVGSHCYRGSLRGNLNEMNKECNRLSCECIQYADSMAEPCACEPCQCIECKPRMLNHRTLVVAAVGDETQTRTCQCSPCECVECFTANYGTSSNLVRHDMSTGLTRHPHCHCETCANEACIPDGNNACRCERHDKVMRKPVPRDSHDYDIRTAMIFQKRPVNKRDIIAMFASITKRHPKFGTYNNKKCCCDLCECLYCAYKESSADAVKSSNIWLPNNNKNYDDWSYKFHPYDQKKHVTINNEIFNSEICNCAECNCLNCNKLAEPFKSYCKKKALSKLSSKGKCKCSPCECTDCNKIMNSCNKDACDCTHCKCKNCVGEVIYPIKKGEKLTPAIFENRIKGSFFRFVKEKAPENYTEIPSMSSHCIMGRNKHIEVDSTECKSRYCDFQINAVKTEHHYNHKRNPRERARRDLRNSLKQTDSFNMIPGKEVTNLKASQSNISLSSSTSNFKDSESDSIQSGNKNKSRLSSCNSSGYDNSNYLVQFPKINTNDMQLSREKSKREVLNMPSIPKNKQIKVSSTFYTLAKENDSKHVSYRPYIENVKTTDKLSYDECSFIQNESFWPIQSSVSNQCNIISGANFEKTYTTTQTENQNETWFENNANSHRQLVDYTKRLREFHKNTIREAVFQKAQNAAHSSKNEFIDNEHYERIQKTLRDARSFSQQLKNMLEEYEKANRDFKSITRDLHPLITHVKNVSNNTDSCSSTSPSEIGFSNITKIFNNMNTIPTKNENRNSARTDQELQENGDKVISNFIQSLDVSKSKEYNTQSNNMSLWEKNCVNESNIDKEIIKIALRNLCSSNCFPGFPDTSTIDHTLHCDNELNPILEEKEPLSDGTVSPTEREVRNKNIKAFNKGTSQETKKFDKVDTEIMKILNLNCDQSIINKNSMGNVAVTNVNLAAYNNVPREIKHLDPKSTFEEHSVDNKAVDIFMIKAPMQSELLQRDAETKPWLILKKNFHVAECEDLCREFCRQPVVEETKESARSISWQPGTAVAHEGPVMRHEDKALINLQSEVKKLVDLPLLQKHETISNSFNKHKHVEKKVVFGNSESNSCDAMKVNFLTVRKVSTHTVMVRWNTPRTLKNVQGYELLVDGQPVQKMLSTSRCMAVVTCLPHSERIILTVRTVMLSPCPNGHHPAASIVYKPRSKM